MGAQEKSTSGNSSVQETGAIGIVRRTFNNTDEIMSSLALDVWTCLIGPQRVKVYRLNNDGKWDDQGTGHVTVDYLERSEELGLYVTDEEDNETLLLHRICPDDIYRKQEDTIISWRDPEYSTELALSFQETTGCSYIWDSICNLQRNMHFNNLNSETYHNMNSELRELPPVELSTLPLILKIIVESGIADQFRVTDLLLHDHNFVQKLIDLFRVCEDLQNVDGLHMIFKIVRGIILLNSPQIFEKLFGDEYVTDIIGCLEYDPDVRHVHHREYLREHVVFKEAIPIKDQLVLSKIHQTYRVGYLKDVVLSRMLDDGLTASLTTIINSNNAMVVSMLKDDSTFIQELFARLKSSSTSAESKKNLVRFLHEFCALGKSLQMVQQLRMYRDLVNEGIFNIIADILRCEDKKLVLMGTDILILFLNQDSNLLRSYVTRQEGTPLFGLLINGMLTDFGDDMHGQFLEILRILMDPYATTSAPQKEIILDIFYERHSGQLMDAITSSCSSNVETRVIMKPEILLSICDLLCYCVLHHAHRIKVNFLDTNAIDKVLFLTQRREKYIAVAAVRFIRTLISRNDEHVMDHIVKNNTLKPIIDAFVVNGNRYNLLNSAVLELFEFIRKENIKILLKYLVDTFWDQLLMFDSLSCIRSLKLKYDQATDSTGLRNKTKISDPRKRVEERSLEKEEDYFNEDSDEEDSSSASMPKAKKGQSQTNLHKGGSMGSPSVSRSGGGLVDYDDDEEDEDYKPPPKRQPENTSENDGVVDSISVKRKSAPKEDPHKKSLQRLPKRPKLNAFSQTLNRASSTTPFKKKTSNIDESNHEEKEVETSTISTDIERIEKDVIVSKDIDKQAPSSPPGVFSDDCGLISNTSSAELAVNGS